MCIKNIINKIIKTFLVLSCGLLLFSCSYGVIKIERINNNNNDTSLLFNIDSKSLNEIKDIYEDVEYIKYTDLEKYYEYSKIKDGDNVIFYEGNIEYYDKDNKIIKTDENVTKLISTTNGEIDSEGINEYGYLIDSFGILVLDSGIHKFGDNYYYVSDDTHKVSKCSNATMSNVVRCNYRSIVDKADGRYIIYDDEERSGELVKNQISNVDGEVYLTDAFGKIVSDEGIHRVSNIYDNTLHLVYEGLDGRTRKANDKEFYCYVNKDGRVVVADLINLDGKIYCADFDGFLVKDAFIFTGAQFNDEMLYVGSESLENFRMKLIYNLLNSKNVDYKNDKEYSFYESKTATESNAIYYFSTGVKNFKEVYVFKNNKLITNDMVRYNTRRYYAGDDGKILSKKVINDYKYKLLLDNAGIVVRDRWLFDRQYFEMKKLNSNLAPYIMGYEVDRSIIKPYLGCYILPTGEIFTDDVYIESALFDKNKNIITKFKVKNGKFDGKYDEYLYRINTYNDNQAEYNYEEYDEGKYAYVRRYTDESRNVKIDINDIDMQLKYNRLKSDYNKMQGSDMYKETVYFGKYYNHDKEGKILEPIEWDIIEKKDGKALLVSHDIIEDMPFDIKSNNTWEKSSLRKWLNGDFINLAFTKEEQERILRNSSDEGRSGTNDKVFLLSSTEFEKYNANDKDEDTLLYNIIFQTTEYLKNGKDDIEYIELITRFWFRDFLENAKEEYKDHYNVIWFMGTKYIRKSKNNCGVRPSIWVEYDDE